MIKVLICDLDGSLMNPSSGLYVKEEIKEKLIEIQKKGIQIVLNSARVFQGVHPLALQIQMDQFGGYVISSNGAHVYDVRKQKTVFEYPINKSLCTELWNITLDHQLEPGYTQPEYAVCHQYTHGYQLDSFNCQIEYKVVDEPFYNGSICKFSVSDTKEKMDLYFDDCKREMEQYDVLAIRSTPYMADVICSSVDKFKTCNRLLQELNISWQEVSSIGDGLSDVDCIKASKLGVTLENGKKECKAVADMIVPSCYEDGCIEWLNFILKGSL